MLDKTFVDNNIAETANYVIIRIDNDTDWSHNNIMHILSCGVQSGTRNFLIDKREHLTPFHKTYSESTLSEIGKCLSKHEAKLAVVLNKDDHIEKMVCLSIMTNGGKVLSTLSIREAQSWLTGSIT